MYSTKIILLAVVLASFSFCDSAKILGVFTSPAKSHLIIHTSVIKALADKGHDVTIITTVPVNDKVKNYRHILVPGFGFSEEQKTQIIKSKIEKPKPFWMEFTDILPKILPISNASLYSPEVQKLMKDETFDLMILGYFFNDFQLGLAAHFKCPVIINFMIQPFTQLVDISGTPRELAYVPNLFTGIKQPMGFSQRLYNFFYTEILEGALHKWADWQQEKYYK